MRFLATLTSLFLAFPVAAGSADHIEVIDPYVRLVPPGARATGVFMTLKNSGEQAAHLVTATSEAAQIVELHDHINDGGVMRMRQIKEIVVPAKGATQLKPGGYHVMLIDLKAPLKADDHVIVTLGFSDGSRKEVHAIVRKPGGNTPAQMHKH